jgi:hypothetical protein
MSELEILRPHAEDAYAEELKKLVKVDNYPRPANWQLSPLGSSAIYYGWRVGRWDGNRTQVLW